jgi:hypothetical protein
MYFDGSSSKEGFGDGIVLISHVQEFITLSCKLEFETNNNIVECEAKQQRLRQYRNEVLDLVGNFFMEFNISFIPREENQKEYYFSLAANTFRSPISLNIK